ncbi:hypothetical protein BJ912DRAFT_931985 [Pholiota molesta]|nr:hypothetical protein BJ912DRAFT_931985 [Pholiota molesta]
MLACLLAWTDLPVVVGRLPDAWPFTRAWPSIGEINATKERQSFHHNDSELALSRQLQNALGCSASNCVFEGDVGREAEGPCASPAKEFETDGIPVSGEHRCLRDVQNRAVGCGLAAVEALRFRRYECSTRSKVNRCVLIFERIKVKGGIVQHKQRYKRTGHTTQAHPVHFPNTHPYNVPKTRPSDILRRACESMVLDAIYAIKNSLKHSRVKNPVNFHWIDAARAIQWIFTDRGRTSNPVDIHWIDAARAIQWIFTGSTRANNPVDFHWILHASSRAARHRSSDIHWLAWHRSSGH